MGKALSADEESAFPCPVLSMTETDSRDSHCGPRRVPGLTMGPCQRGRPRFQGWRRKGNILKNVQAF